MFSLNRDAPVLVTGASGYIASWIIRYLLEEGFTVHGTVRQFVDKQRIEPLQAIAQDTPGKLRLFEANLLRHGDYQVPMQGCQVVIHTASPFLAGRVRKPQRDVVDPILEGISNVLLSVEETPSVQRVVFTSSLATVFCDTKEVLDRPKGFFTEADWNIRADINYHPFKFAKTVAERQAWKMAGAQDRWDLVVINPGLALGPALHRRQHSASIDFFLGFLRGRYRFGMPDLSFGFVDVRDLAMAHVQAAMNPAASGRHILVNEVHHMQDIARILREAYPRKFFLPNQVWSGWISYLLAPFLGISWAYLRENQRYHPAFDNSYSIEDLGADYRPFQDTILDQSEQVLRDGLV